ncbi:MAG: nuclease-related domain-containing protein [Microbacteriaceae bacterium]
MSEGVSDVDTVGGLTGPPTYVTVGWSEALRIGTAGYETMRACLTAQEVAPARRSARARWFGIDPLTPSARPLFYRAVAERRVGLLLEELGGQWDVLHAIPRTDPDQPLEHLIVGPPGVFVLRGYDLGAGDVWLRGATLVARRHRQSLDDLQEQAEYASRMLGLATALPIEVRPIAVLLDPGRVWARPDGAGLIVLSNRELVTWLLSRPSRYCGDEIVALSVAAETAATWNQQATVRVLQGGVALAFDSLRQSVTLAGKPRRVWAGVAAVVVIAGAWAAAFSVTLGHLR